MPNKQNIGFIGLGAMGAGMATNLLRAGFAVTGFDLKQPALARLVELRFFAGLTLDEAADILGVSRRKAARDWSVARLWLQRELGGG